ncbi:MAG: chemotaxis protein CheD [Verrucomicrobiota bacterium]|nr:chemotaxis protein CheD [Verrucomicrobiota bacterium]
MSFSNKSGFENRVVIGLAEFTATKRLDVVLATYSLGSCLGVAIYDPVARVGGLLHAMLPDSNLDPVKAARQPGMFLDTGLEGLLAAAVKLGASPMRLQVYIAGGAQIMDNSGFFSIGKRNYSACQELLPKLGLTVKAEHVGGLVNRTMYLQMFSGEVFLKVSGQSKESSL